LKGQSFISAGNDSFVFHECDLKTTEPAKEAGKAAISNYGNIIDGLANVAGMMNNNASVDTLQGDQWDRSWRST